MFSPCPSVRPSACHMPVFYRKVKRIIKLFSTLGSHTIPVFPHQPSGMVILRRGPPNGSVICRGGMKKIAIFSQYPALSRKRYKREPYTMEFE